ncbi:protein FAM221A [Manacus candei]|nr:protein FAM221A [Manacus candei]
MNADALVKMYKECKVLMTSEPFVGYRLAPPFAQTRIKHRNTVCEFALRTGKRVAFGKTSWRGARRPRGRGTHPVVYAAHTRSSTRVSQRPVRCVPRRTRLPPARLPPAALRAQAAPGAPGALTAAGPVMERLQVEAEALEEYAEYRRIVGDDDGGKLFTPEEYEEYKRKVLPIRLQNRLYVSWRSPTGMDCKLVGPETLCFCTHRYKQHKTDYEVLPKERPICVPCRVRCCPCQSYHYVPLNGTQPIRCRCKHFADQHSAAPGFPCNSCSKCSGFHSCFTCACGQPTYAHETVVETKEERLAQGKPVGQDVPYAAMGGLTGFSSLAEGYMRLDDSGIGAPSAELLEAPVTSMDHPFLKAFQGPSSSAQTISQRAGSSSATGQISHGKPSEEDDMAYFEKRYQERLKMEKAAKRRGKSPVPSKKP